MRFNRRIGPIKAISFDLDDTLYSNREVMLATEAAMIAHFAQLLKDHQNDADYSASFWLGIRKQLISLNPSLKHDVTEIRRQVYFTGLQQHGFDKNTAEQFANEAMAVFLFHRNKVEISAEIHHFLRDLASRYPLIAISNGNVDTQVIGIRDYFCQTYHAGNGYQQKPANDLFHLACGQLNIAPKQLLHVGDCGHSDIKGALRAGCQSAWLNCYTVGKPITSLPDIELNAVTDIAKFL